MFVHTVYFWLKSGLGDDARAKFLQGLLALKNVPTVKAMHVGQPVPSERPVVDGSYSFGLTVIFDNAADHDAYQVHPLHKAFAQEFAPYWDRIRVYDFE
jgi:hypothetical protein